ncbi:MAG: hypothetical protein H4O13_02130 [Xanthomonadales bacterium]|nr:hypothetical protein [Xanthomonadales bacterium]
MNFHLAVAALCLGLASLSAHAAPIDITTSASTIDQLLRYSDEEPAPGAKNDLVVSVTDPLNAGVCRGGWISKSDAQYQEFFQILTAAKLSRARVRLIGDPSRRWTHSSDNFCYLHVVALL